MVELSAQQHELCRQNTAGPGPSYLDRGSGGPENEFTNRNATFMTWNLLHLARMITAGRWRRKAPWLVAAAFTVSGVVHLAHPATFTSIVPDFLPAKTALVYVSGVAELVCAAGLWRRDRWAAIAAAALLIVIWPANLQMAINAQEGNVTTTKVEDWIRLPLQIPLIWCALQAGRLPTPARRRRTAG